MHTLIKQEYYSNGLQNSKSDLYLGRLQFPEIRQVIPSTDST